MPRTLCALIMLYLISAMGCAPSVPQWRQQARIALDTAQLEGADQRFPAEYDSARGIFEEGLLLMKREDVQNADIFFRFAYIKANMLEEKFSAEKIRRAEEIQRKIKEEKLEVERQRAIFEDRGSAARERAAAAGAEKRLEKVRQQKERALASQHTVKRGETLPQISAQADVYNDYRLWPLLYRANRDQISNPKHVWPGQVLRIPRSWNREDIAEARRYSQEKPI